MLDGLLKDILCCVSQGVYEGVSYCRDELSWYDNKICVVHNGKLHLQGKDIPAFRYRDSNDSRLIKLGDSIGNTDEFRKEFNSFVEGFPLVQLIFSYYMSGAIRQLLELTSESVGEYGLVVCLTGETGSGKTTVTSTLQNILFGKGRLVNNNSTSYGLYSGICPVVRDDGSTDTRDSVAHRKEKIMDIYNIASGKCRITCNSDEDVPLYAPFIESREEYWGLADLVKPIRQVEGYKYRILELYCHKGDLTSDAQEARRFAELSGKYSGMAVVFLDYLVDNYTENEVREIYKKYVAEMDIILEKNGLERRYSNRIAVILATASICMKAYGVRIDIEKIKTIIIEAIQSLERRLIASPDMYELKQLYKFFTDRDVDGRYINDKYISDSVGHFIHKKNYVAFLEKKKDEFYIPTTLLNIIVSDDIPISEPGFWGYDVDNLDIDIGKPEGERWKTIFSTWAELGILIYRSGTNAYTKSVKLNGVLTTCYHFSWKKIAQQFGDNNPIDKTRFAHDSEEKISKEQKEIFDTF